MDKEFHAQRSAVHLREEGKLLYRPADRDVLEVRSTDITSYDIYVVWRQEKLDWRCSDDCGQCP